MHRRAVDRAGDRHRQPSRYPTGHQLRLADPGGCVGRRVRHAAGAATCATTRSTTSSSVGSSTTPGIYNVAAMWSALEGSILLWVLVLAAFTAAVAWRFRSRADDELVGVGARRHVRRVRLLRTRELRAGQPVRRRARRRPSGSTGPARTRSCRTTSWCCSTRRSCTSATSGSRCRSPSRSRR